MKLDYDVVIPKDRKRTNGVVVRKVVQDFSVSGQEVAEVIAIEDCYKNQASAYIGIRNVIEALGLMGKISVIKSGDRLFLVKLTGEKQ